MYIYDTTLIYIFVSYIFPPYSRRWLAPYILCISMTPRWYTSSYLTFSRHIQCALTITRHSMYHWHPTRYISSYFLFSRHSQDALATPSANAPAVATLHATQHDARVWAVSERCVAVCCRVRGCVLQSVAVCWMCCSVRQCVVVLWKVRGCVLQCVAVCRSVLQCVAVCCMCCSVRHCVAVCCNVLPDVAVCCIFGRGSQRILDFIRCVAVCCSVLQCVAVCCSVSQFLKRIATCTRLHSVRSGVLQCVAECCSVL